MTASVLKQYPNTKGFTRTPIYFDRTHSMLSYFLTRTHSMLYYFLTRTRSTLYFDTDTQYRVSRVKINKRSFEPCVSIE